MRSPRARNDIPGHEVKTVAEVGWAGVKNGQWLRLAAAEFDLLITVDRNLEYQQSFEGLSLAVIVVQSVARMSEAKSGVKCSPDERNETWDGSCGREESRIALRFMRATVAAFKPIDCFPHCASPHAGYI